MAPFSSSVTSAVTHSKNGSFEISWTTIEPATSDIQIGGTVYTDSTLTSSKKRSFRGSK